MTAIYRSTLQKKKSRQLEFWEVVGDLNIQGDCYIIQVNFAEIIIKATGNFGKLSGDLNIQGDRYIQGSDNTGLTVLHSLLETKKETKSNTSVCCLW